jgi:hypothetical protein
MEIGPVCPFEIIGKASAEAPAAPARNLRRVVLGAVVATLVLSFMNFSSWGYAAFERRLWESGRLARESTANRSLG